MQSQEPKRVHLQIAREALRPDRWADRDTSFAGMLQNLLDSAAAASEAKSMGKAHSCESRDGVCASMTRIATPFLRLKHTSLP